MMDALDIDTYATPVSGADVARAAWAIPANVLAAMLGDTVPASEHDEVRSQFALWATADSAREFSDGIWEAWDAFVAPKLGINAAVILLPGAACRACSHQRFVSGSTAISGVANCIVCHGTGRTAPRPLPARSSARALQSLAGHAAAAQTESA